LIVWQKPNLLLLDEPTNHLDIEMRHALTMALQNYEGALLVISHDRHLLRNTVDEFYLVADGTLCEFEGDLKDYQVWLKNFVRDINAEPSPALEPAEDKKVARQKAAQNRERIAPITKKIRQLETLMTQLQSKLAQIENQLADEDIYKEEKKTELNSCLSGQIEMKKRLSNCEEQWLEYQEELEPENS